MRDEVDVSIPRSSRWIAAISMTALCACNTTSLPFGGGASSDMAIPGDSRSPGPDMSPFCGASNSARINLNGMLATSPAVSGSAIPFNCCDGAEFGVISMQIATPIVFAWRHQVGQAPNLPVTLDLGSLPAGWSVLLESGCVTTQSNCKPTDRYDSGFTGTLTIAGHPGGYEMSTCLHVAETANSPHPVIHTLDFFSPTIAAN